MKIAPIQFLQLGLTGFLVYRAFDAYQQGRDAQLATDAARTHPELPTSAIVNAQEAADSMKMRAARDALAASALLGFTVYTWNKPGYWKTR